MSTTTDPNLSYYTQVQQMAGSSNPQTGLLGMLGESQAPQVAQAQTQIAQTEQQLGDLGPALAEQADYATLMSQYQTGNLDIKGEQLGLQQQGTAQQYGIQQQQFQQQAQQEQLGYERSLQSAIGGAAAGGSLMTSAAKQQQGDIGQQYAWEQQSLQGQEQLSAGDYARAQQNYALLGQANGLSQQEVQSRLAYGLTQLGQNMDPTSLVAQAGNALSSQAQDVGSVISQAGLLGGLNALSGLG
jgi:hypothetical protein